MKLIELILQDYEIDDDVTDQRTLSLSISKIVEYYFKSIPSSDNDDDEDDSDDDDDEDDDCYDDEGTKKASTKDPPRDCEELAMLLLYLMQSYIWSSNGRYRPRLSSHKYIRDKHTPACTCITNTILHFVKQ